ncbi:ceramidase [Zalerion maritima]|uniref:Ceramidase n=1 Tax=Zalerion maritima TaxID=339359 RepID=A0AAD5RP18_9PEZI|nr:ceramidase [Zalerion maritima]
MRNGHPTIFLLAYAGYLIVGLGSISFHATLKYPMQLFDELSMIYTTCLMCFAATTHGKSTRVTVILGVSLIGVAAFITGYYHITKDPKFHQNAYGILTVSIVFWSLYVMEFELRPQLEKRMGPAVSASMFKEMRRMLAYGLTMFLSGYLIWNLDNWYCGYFLQWRNHVLLPWAILLEGHAWWHILTGIGGYYYITWWIWLNALLDGMEKHFKFVWPNMVTSFAEVVRVDHGGAKGK